MYKDKEKQKQAHKEAMQRYRTKQGITEASITKQGITQDIPQGITSLTAEQLYDKINIYPHDSWVSSTEHKELMRRLHAFSIEQLQAEGYFIPVWKYAEERQTSRKGFNE